MAIIVYRWQKLPPPRNDQNKVWLWVGLGLLAFAAVIGCLNEKYKRPVTAQQPVPVQQFQPGQWGNNK